MKLSTKWLAPICIALFVYLLWKSDIVKIYQTIKNANIFLILISIAINIPIVLIKSWKWQVLLNAHKESPTFLKSIKTWLIGLFGENVTPGRIGTVVRSFYFDNVPRALSATVIDRLVELILLFAIGSVGIILVFFWFSVKNFIFVLIAYFVLLPFLIYIIFNQRLVKKMMTPFFKFVIPEKYREKLKLTFAEFYESLGYVIRNQKRRICLSFIIGAMGWLAVFLQSFVIARAINMEISFFYISAFVSVVGVVQSLPITISGFGTREASSIFLFSLLGISAAMTMAFNLIGLVVGLIIPAAIGGILFAMKPASIKL